MKTSVSVSDFRDAFKSYGRDDNFTYEGLGALFEYLEEYEESCDTELELDVIALCCDFTEYADLAEFQADYGEDYTDIETISNNTTVIEVSEDAFIIQAF